MRTKKVLVIFLLATIASLTIATSALFANSDTTLTAHLVNFRILVNNEEQNFTYPIVVINDRTYVPLREVGEALNMDVKWCAENREIAITSQQTSAENASKVFERPNASEGVLSTGIRYVFDNTDFSVNNFIAQNLGTSRSVNSTVIANTPTEAAELGQFYLHPSIRDKEPDLGENFGKNVYYCAETDSWVLQLRLVGWEDYPIPGLQRILVINRLSGSIADYF